MMKMHLEDADLLKELKMENEQLKKKLAEVCMRMCLYTCTYTVSGSSRKKFLGGSSQIFDVGVSNLCGCGLATPIT